jgi:hypothetical protein
MATELNEFGLSIATKAELDATAQEGLVDIYGEGTNFGSNTADGQYFGITTQTAVDYLEVLLDIYNMLDPDNTIGTQQDNLYWINGIKRKAGNFSFQTIQITTDRALTLNGLDANANDVDGIGYTIADNIGNEWVLLDTQNPASAGTYSYSFRSRNLGAISSSPNTITNPVDIILGVVSINNPTGVSSLGNEGETDTAFSIRRSRSFAKRSTNSLDGLFANLASLTGVATVAVYENDKDVVDSDGIPAQGFWVVIDGGSNEDIGNTIYQNVVKGLPSKGDEVVEITTIQNQIYTARFDRTDSNPLYIKFDLKPLKSGITFNLTAIKEYMVANKVYNINEDADTGSLTDLARNAIINVNGAGSATALSLLISDDDSTWVSFLESSSKKDKWILDVDNITITEI